MAMYWITFGNPNFFYVHNYILSLAITNKICLATLNKFICPKNRNKILK